MSIRKRPRPGVMAALAVLATASATPASGALTPPMAKLRVSNTRIRELRTIAFDASASRAGAGIAGYQFDYGDGIIETTSQPFMLHAYQRPGTFHAKVTIIDRNLFTATSQAVKIRVRDGIAPLVRINSPRPNQHVHLGTSGVVISGTASDQGPGASGVRRVEIALQFLSISARPGCFWFDGQHALAVRLCNDPLFFRVTRHGKHWSFRLDPATRFPAGVYAVRVRATDHAGNVSQWYAVRLRTILGFVLS